MRNFYNLLKGGATTLVLLLFMLIGIPTQVNAQYCNTPTTTDAITPTLSAQLSTSYSNGRRAFTFNATAGCSYRFETCSQSTVDTYLRLYSGTGGTLLVTADDNCGSQSQINWTCTSTGPYSILMTNWSCAVLSGATRLNYYITGCVVPYNPCTTIPTVAACATATTANFTTGNNTWNMQSFGGPYATPGQERIFSFTPTQSGNYQISQSSASSNYVDYFYKAASGGCVSSGWTYIDDIYGNNVSNGNVNIALTAGTQYYFLLDPETDANFSVTWQLVCPPAPPAWKSQWVSMSVPSTWCAGQAQNVSVTVTNIGASTWSDASPDINIGCKWNAEADYYVRVNAAGIAPNASRTYTLTMTGE
jgi:hypothetical protein